MAELAGQTGDGICVPVGPAATELIAVARRARLRSDRDQPGLLVTALLPSWTGTNLSLLGSDVDRLIVYVAPPFEKAIPRLGHTILRWRTEVL
jgi:hypothetical protein